MKRIAFDTKLCLPGCALIQSAMGGLDNEDLARYFPTETWLLAPTPDMGVYPVTEAQLKELSVMAKRGKSTTDSEPSEYHDHYAILFDTPWFYGKTFITIV